MTRADDISEISARHQPTQDEGWDCKACGHTYPCGPARLVAEVNRLQALVDRSAEFWRAAAADQEHAVLSAKSLRFMAQDFLAMLHEASEEEPC